MKRVRKWTRRLAMGLGVAALIALGLWVWLVPALVERLVTAELEAVGLPSPLLRVRGLSLTHFEMTNLAAGEDGRLRIGAVGVDYSLSQLLGKRVDSIEILGFEAEIRRKDGAWDLGPLANLHAGAGAEMPFRRITLLACTLVLELDGRRMRVPFSGTVESTGNDTLAIDLTTYPEGAPLRLAGTFNTKSQDFRLAVDGEVPEVAALLASAPPWVAAIPRHAGGAPTVRAAIARDKGVLSLDATAEGAGWKLSQFSVTETGLEDWLRGKADLARINCRWDIEADKPWPLIETTPLGQWIDGRAIAGAALAAEGVLELRRTKTDSGPGLTWSATVPRVRLTLAPSDLAIPAADVMLAGVTADLRMTAAADADNLRVELLPQSAVSATGASAGRGDARITLARGEKPGLNLVVGERPVAVSVALREGKSDWKVEAPHIRLTLTECRLSLPGAGGEVAGLAGDFAFRADADPKRIMATLLSGSWVAFKSVEIKAGDEAVRVGAAKLAFTERENRPLLAAAFEGGRLLSLDGALIAEAVEPVTASVGDGATLKLSKLRSTATGSWRGKDGAFTADLDLSGIDASLARKSGDSLFSASAPEVTLLIKARRDAAAGPGPEAPLSLEFVIGTPNGGKGMSVAAGDIDVAAGTVEARGTVVLAGTQPPAINARVLLTDGAVQHKAAGLALAGIAADVPLVWNLKTPPEPGRFAVKSINLAGSTLPEFSGTLGLADMRGDFTVAWEPLPGAKLRLEGTAASGTRGPSARAYVSLPLAMITDEEALGRLVPQLKGVLAGGSFALDGYVRVSADGIVPNLALTVLDGTFKSKAWEADAEGVYATVRINSLRPMLTPRQELQVALVRHAKIGKLDVSDGFVAFRIEPKEAEAGRPTGWTAYVQRGEWGWVGGRLYVEDLRFDPAAAEHTLVINARDLKLAGLLSLIPKEEATGVGSLDGKLPVTIGTWPNIRFGEGELRTAPGQSGWFRIKNTEILGTVLEGTDNRFRTEDLYVEIKNRLINGFRDFEYDELSVVFVKEGDGLVARVNTRGRARTGVRQEFGDVTMNFLHFDEVLRDVILIGRGIPGH